MKPFIPFVLVLAACASDHTAKVRFANAPTVTAVDDRRDVKKAPEARYYSRMLYHVRGNLTRRVERGMEVRAPQRALGVNSMDEAPNSTWFTNRIGVRELSPAEVRIGAATVGSPEPHLPWTITSTKQGGMSVGFIIKDARGEKWILKFDNIGKGEMETGADAVTSRLYWAAGFNTAEDHVVYFDPSQLVLGKGAVVKDDMGGETKLTKKHLAEMLAKVEHGKDGQMRGLASRFLDGKWLGGHVPEGTRHDDPNDRIPHQNRRDLRGASALHAWLDHGDVKEDNFLDMYVEDPARPNHHYVRHYFIDTGLTLGAMSSSARDPRRGVSYAFDAPEMGSSFVTLGVKQRPWEGRIDPKIPGVGWYAAEDFDPAAWKPYTPTYVPTLIADRFDHFWGAKIMMRFTRAHLAAALEAGRYSNPRTAPYLLDTMVARQRKSARHWFTQTNPLDGFALSGSAICFDDLLIRYDLQDRGSVTTYTVDVTNSAGQRLPQRAAAATPIGATPSGHACTVPLAFSGNDEGYTRVRLTTHRPGFEKSTWVHIARSHNEPHIVGMWRE